MAVGERNRVEIREDSVARGTLALISVQVAFLIGGYFIHVYLGRGLGPVDYGMFGVAMAFLVWMEVSLTGGFPYAIRKFGAENREQMPAIARAAMKGQFIYALILFAISLAAAPWIARILQDERLTGLLRIASLDIPLFAFYFCYMAVLNGKRRYSLQAAAMMAYAIGKVIMVLALVAAGFGVPGALIGNVASSVAGLVVAAVLTGRLPKADPYPISSLVKFAGGTSALAILVTLMTNLDLFAVKALSKSAESAGFYTAAATLAKAPFMMLLGITGATLPAVSRAASLNNTHLVVQYVGQALRLHLLMIAPITALLAGAAPGIVDMLYTNRYAPTAEVVPILVLAMMFCGIINTFYNVFVAMGDTRTPVIGTTLLIIMAGIINLMLIPRIGLPGAAIATLAASVAGLAGVWAVCRIRLGRVLPRMTIVRSLAAAGVIYVITVAVPAKGPALVAECAALFALYLVLLGITREITRKDISKIASAVGFKGRGA